MNNLKELRFPFGKHKGKLLKDIPKNYINWLSENKILDKPDLKQIKESLIKLGVLSENT